MKDTITPTNVEITVPDDKILVTKTDPEGIISYVNSEFIKLSGYSESELLGKQHNISRHPDMPRVIFKLLWDILKNNREFNGYFKNMSKNGDYYWGFVNVTPIFSIDNELLGYNSIWRQANADKLNYIQNLYHELLEIEQQSSSSDGVEEAQFKLDSVLNGREKGYDEFILTI